MFHFTCQEVGHVSIQPLDDILSSINKDGCVGVAGAEECPLESLPQIPSGITAG